MEDKYTLEEIVESFINGNISWCCDQVREMDNTELVKLLKCYSENIEF